MKKNRFVYSEYQGFKNLGRRTKIRRTSIKKLAKEILFICLFYITDYLLILLGCEVCAKAAAAVLLLLLEEPSSAYILPVELS